MSNKQQHAISNATMLQACMALQSQISFAENMAAKCAETGLDAGARHFWETSRDKAATALNELTGI